MAKAVEKASGGSTIYSPIQGSPEMEGGEGVYGDNRGDHIHAGVDIATPLGTPCIAPVDGRIVQYAQDSGFAPGEGIHEGGGMIQFEFQTNLGPIKAGDLIGWGHVFHVYTKVGESVKAGQKIATSGETSFNGAQHVHFIYQSPHDGAMDGSDNPEPIYTYLKSNGKNTSGTTVGGAGNTPEGAVEVGNISAAEVAAISQGSALAAYLNLPTLEISEESLALKGERSLMNDKPLMEFITEMCEASLRNFMSMPDGSFFAWLPDYFGGLTERTPYWEINDTEVISGTMELSDDALATHVYVVGDTGVIDQTIDPLEKIQSAGVVTIFNAFQADFITGYGSGNQKAAKEAPILASKEGAINFLERYGARPYYQEAPFIRSHYFEMFLAYQMFCLLWSQQFSTKFEFTFMPELFPGGIIAFPQHGIQCYVQEVRHEGSYEEGFRTIAELTAPAALGNSPEGVHDGMVRSEVFNPQTIQEYARNTGGNRGQGQERNLNRKSK